MIVPSYLRLTKENVFVFRRRIPNDLWDHFTTNELRISLKTNNYKQALIISRALTVHSDHLFIRLRQNMTVENDDSVMRLITEKMKHIKSVIHNEELQSQIASMKERHQQDLSLVISAKASENLLTVSPLLSTLMEDFLSAAHIARRSDKPATARKDKDALNLFLDIVGDKAINGVTQVDAVTYSQKVKTHNSSKKLRADRTVNNHMGSISKFSKWVTVFHSQAGHAKLDFSSLRYKIEASDNEERLMFEYREVHSILTDERFLELRNSATPMFWLIAIAIYSGMRLEEISQLDPNTDVYHDEVWVFNINEYEDRNLKNKPSRRVIAIHPALIDLGILDYIASLQGKSKNLFPDEVVRDGRIGKNIGRRANRFLANTLGRSDKTLHCFRHTITTMFKQKMVEEGVAAAILGHKHGGITYNRYGKGYKSSTLLETMKLIRFDE